MGLFCWISFTLSWVSDKSETLLQTLFGPDPAHSCSLISSDGALITHVRSWWFETQTHVLPSVTCWIFSTLWLASPSASLSGLIWEWKLILSVCNLLSVCAILALPASRSLSVSRLMIRVPRLTGVFVCPLYKTSRGVITSVGNIHSRLVLLMWKEASCRDTNCCSCEWKMTRRSLGFIITPALFLGLWSLFRTESRVGLRTSLSSPERKVIVWSVAEEILKNFTMVLKVWGKLTNICKIYSSVGSNHCEGKQSLQNWDTSSFGWLQIRKKRKKMI